MSDHQRKVLAMMIGKFGEGSRMVGHYRNQIAASQKGQSAQQMYVTGMIKRKPTGQ
tara:strand:+ start:273 stop:440 length:168 start_codon:yes stop_codon:yes gene_type:complete